MRRHKQRRSLNKCRCEVCKQHPYSRVAKEHRTINRVLTTLDEKGRRRFAGLLALQIGRGGVQFVHEVTGLSRMTVRAGREEIRQIDRLPGVRHSGGGRQAVEKNSPRFWKT